MELKVGMYVRTKDTGFCKIVKRLELDGLYTDKGFNIISNILKSSFNIIDLIEVGDYVNGWLVNAVYSDGMRLIGVEDGIEYNDEIKEVLTHEQYEANCFKIGE